jgi:putative DNA primase/helicase
MAFEIPEGIADWARADVEKMFAKKAAASAPPPDPTPVLTPFEQRAMAMVSRGIPVTVLRVKDKPAILPEWQKTATTDITQIQKWAAQYPENNVGAVARAEIGAVFFLEIDSNEVLRRIKTETGKAMPDTFSVRSSPKRGHFYFKHTAKSIACGNIAQGYVKGGDWSLRADGQYVVAPGSISPKTGQPYTIIDDLPIIGIPDWLVEWCESQRESKLKPAEREPGELVPHGKINDYLTRFIGKMIHENVPQEAALIATLATVHENCAPPIDENRVIRDVQGMYSRYPAGTPLKDMVYFGDKPAGSTAAGAATSAESTAVGSHLVTTRGDQVKTKTIKWLWANRVPFAKLTVFAGNPDQGKSLVTMHMVCQLTTGKPLYGSTDALPPCEVLILAGEDEADDTIVPRLQADGADLTKIHIVQAVAAQDGKGVTVSEREVQLDKDIQAIEEVIEIHPQIRLVVIDPLSNYLGNSNMNREQEVRQVLNPLRNLAARRQVAIVSVMHLNKSTDGSAIHRIGGAVAFTGIARAVWLFGEDPNDTTETKDKKMMLRVKGNIARRVGGLMYEIKTKPVLIEGKPVEQPVISWIGETVQTAQDVLIAGRPAGRPDGTDTKRHDAEEWLKEFLKDGSETQTDIEHFSKKARFTWRTIRRAKESLGVISEKAGKNWEWRMPNTELLSAPVDLETKS